MVVENLSLMWYYIIQQGKMGSKGWATNWNLGAAICKMKRCIVCVYRTPERIMWCKLLKDWKKDAFYKN